MMQDPLISARELAQHEPRPVLLDARSGPNARAAYAEGHLEGARWVDLERELAAPTDNAAQGGRHPLPALERFAATVGRWGIAPETEVVVYDDQGGANAAARTWWMLRALGHARARVLDGGLQAAIAIGLPLTTAITTLAPPAPPYPAPKNWGLPIATSDEVALARTQPTACVLDVRSAARFLGREEPIDPLAGHIPGALNLPFQENLAAAGTFKDADTLRAQYLALLDGRSASALIVHCGSGVTACHTLLALDRAQLLGARLYVGSWSEWCRQPERPRAP